MFSVSSLFFKGVISCSYSCGLAAAARALGKGDVDMEVKLQFTGISQRMLQMPVETRDKGRNKGDCGGRRRYYNIEILIL